MVALCTLLSLATVSAAQNAAVYAPQLLLTPQRLRRLQRDRERQTVRWINFENRVQSAPDSPERGFELALYYAVTRDQNRAKGAVEWAITHSGERRQTALILDWCNDVISDADRTKLITSAAKASGADANAVEQARDALFMAVATGADDQSYKASWGAVLSQLKDGRFADPRILYAASEFLDAVRTTEHLDLREDAPNLFTKIPVEYLLSLRPREVDHPNWRTHIAALAYVSIDPNLAGSQFLQAWAMEDPQMVQDGPGVAYEFLWGDPYLPGVGYQNSDLWLYDPNKRLLARSDWTEKACWVDISAQGVEDVNCPADWRENWVTFGQLTLIPTRAVCTTVPMRKNGEAEIVWGFRPFEGLWFFEGGKVSTAKADAAGLWPVPEKVDGNVCKVATSEMPRRAVP